jgi:hypothetical protein
LNLSLQTKIQRKNWNTMKLFKPGDPRKRSTCGVRRKLPEMEVQEDSGWAECAQCFIREDIRNQERMGMGARMASMSQLSRRMPS